jgi:hypothetical protein
MNWSWMYAIPNCWRGSGARYGDYVELERDEASIEIGPPGVGFVCAATDPP